MFMIPEKSGVGFFDAFRVRDGDCARTTGGSERHDDAVVVHALGFATRKRGLAVNDKAVRHGFNVCTEVFERRFHGKQTVTLL